MMRWLAIGLVGVVYSATHGAAGSVEKQAERSFKTQAYGKRTFVEEFRANERASAIVIGVGHAIAGSYLGPYMAVYVFDRHGNCVAWDDEGTSAVRDDLAVQWQPLEQTFYAIEVFNQGNYGNSFRLVVR